jgi:hypothetical protein
MAGQISLIKKQLKTIDDYFAEKDEDVEYILLVTLKLFLKIDLVRKTSMNCWFKKNNFLKRSKA